MALPLNSYRITETIYHLANIVSVSLMLSECTGHQTAKKKKKLRSADRTLFFRLLCIYASNFLFFHFLVTSQGLNSLTKLSITAFYMLVTLRLRLPQRKKKKE